MEKTKGQILMDELLKIKYLLNTSQVSYDEAKAKARPIIDTLNFEVLRVAKEHKMRPKYISFISFMR